MKYIRKILLYLLITLVSAFMIVPVIFTILGSFAKRWGEDLFSNGVTLMWYQEVFHQYGDTILFTLIISILTVIINIFLGTMTAYYFYKHRGRFMNILEEILTLPLSVPAIAIALALIQTYALLRGAGMLILIGHVIVTFPLMFRTILGTLRSKDYEAIDESASTLGAGPLYRFIHVIIPSIKSSVISGSMLVFLLSLGEFNMTFFLYTPLTETMPVGLFQAYASLRIEIGSAFTVIFLVIAIPIMFYLHRTNQASNLTRGGI